MRMRGVVIGTAIGVAAGIGISRARRWQQTWGVDPVERTASLAGDEIVAEPIAMETRGISIEAPPSAVWPWLVQMGYGRAGWYSYDQLDQRGRSADDVVDAWQSIAVGDTIPTHPGGGFEVSLLDPGRALVLRSDTALVKAQAEAAAVGGADQGTVGVQASGAILGSTPQDFAASWAFVLEPVDGGSRTRLIERFRVWYGKASPGANVVMPFVGFGVFVMMQRQMEGIRTRAERLAAATPTEAGSSPADEAAAVEQQRVPEAVGAAG